MCELQHTPWPEAAVARQGARHVDVDVFNVTHASAAIRNWRRLVKTLTNQLFQGSCLQLDSISSGRVCGMPNPPLVLCSEESLTSHGARIPLAGRSIFLLPVDV